MTARRAMLAALVCGSGFAALVYQVAWLRELRLVFGSSTAANAAVLFIFMGGLGLGSLWFGRRADQHRNPLALYGRLELSIAGLAAVSPLLIGLVSAIYLGMGGSLSLGSVGGTLVRLVLATLVLGVPTFLMGGTLPAISRAVETDADTSRRYFAFLYGANTLGAVAGAFIATFVMLEALGVRLTVLVAALLNALVAGSALLLARRAPTDTEPAPAASTEAAPDLERRAPLRLVLVAAALVGFAFLLMELVWYRMLAPILGGSSYTFGLILAFALLGIGIGALLYRRRPPERPVTLHTLASTCMLEAALVAVPLALGDRIALLAHFTRDFQNVGFEGLVLSWSLIAAIVVLPAAIVAGYQLPVLVALLGTGRKDVGREVGLVYASNTGGAIVGSLAGGFGLLPLLSAPGAWRLAAMVLLAVGALALFPAHVREARRKLILPLLLAALAVACLTATGPTAVWRHTPIGAGLARLKVGTPNELEERLRQRRRSVLWERDGVESSVAFARGPANGFVVNGKPDGNARLDAPSFVMSGVLGAILHPEPKSAFVIGLGTGATAGWLAAVPSLATVDVVELEPAVVEVARACGPVNLEAMSNPRVNVMIGDGREVLRTTSQRYDLILSQPSNPYRAGISSLYSLEFFQAAAERLNDGGLFLQWLQGYHVDARTVGIAYTTLHAVFESVEIWEMKQGSDLLLVASREPLRHDLRRLRQSVASEPYQRALATIWGVEGLDGLFSAFLANRHIAAPLAELEDVEVSTDDNHLVEYGFVRYLGREGRFKIADLRALAAALEMDRAEVTGGTLDWQLAEELRTVRAVIEATKAPEIGPRASYRARRSWARRTFAEGQVAIALRHWQAQPDPAEQPVDLMIVAEGLALRGAKEAPRWIDALARQQPTQAEALRARWHAMRRDFPAATRSLVAAFQAYRRDPWPLGSAMARALELARNLASWHPPSATELFEVLAEPFAVGMLDGDRQLIRAFITTDGDLDQRCVPAFEALEPHFPWKEQFLEQRVRCYAAHAHPGLERAESDLAEFRAAAPTGLLPRTGPNHML